MNTLLKAATRLHGLRAVLNSAKHVIPRATTQQRQLARTLWYLCNSERSNACITQKNSVTCSCGCGGRGVHSKAEKELVEFLTEEILAERKAQKVKTIPSEIDGFSVKLDGAEVTLTKQVNDETIKVTFNVNHSVDTDAEPELHPNMDKAEVGELKSKPSFTIELVRNKTTVSIVCTFLVSGEQDEGFNDIFGIDEISIYDGEFNENVYSVSGEVVDSYLYDLILNYLEEKGISNSFVEKLSEFSTAYEHSAYIGLLEGLSRFASGK